MALFELGICLFPSLETFFLFTFFFSFVLSYLSMILYCRFLKQVFSVVYMNPHVVACEAGLPLGLVKCPRTLILLFPS